MRHFHFPLDDFFQHPEPVQAGHLHVQKYEVRRVLLDQRDGFHAVLPLADHIDLGKAFQEECQLVACRLLVIHDDGVD